MKIAKLLAILICTAMFAALVPIDAIAALGSGEESKEARLAQLLDFSKRTHEMTERFATKCPKKDAEKDPFATSRLIVKSAKELDYSGSIAHVSGYNERHIIQYATPQEAKKAAEAYRKLDFVEYAAPDAVMTIAQLPHNNDFLSWGYGPDHVDAFNYNEWLLENGVSVDQLPEIKVGIIDTGIDASHPFLAGRIISSGYDFSNGDDDPSDDHYHGTHVAGTVIDGTLPNVKLIGVKVMGSDGSGYTSDIISGFEYCYLNGFQIANASLRGIRDDSSFEMYSDVINAGFDAGTVYCVASGNDGRNAYDYVPGAVERAFTVAAHDQNRRMAGFSNTGGCVDITAPGVQIKSCIPNEQYESLDGTSMATPHVSAACAMLKTFKPELDPDSVVSVIKAASVDEGLVGGGVGLLCVKDLLKYDLVLGDESKRLHFTSVGAYPWATDAATAFSSNAGAANSVSTLTAKPKLGAFERISFEYRVSSQKNRDFLRFRIDGETVFEASGESGWQTYTCIIPGSGRKTLSWEFSKDSGGDSGSDKAWLRNVALENTLSTVISGGDDPLELTSGGSYPWIIEGDAAKSGNSGVNSSVSEIASTRQLVEGISIGFMYKTECGFGDRFEFLVNDMPLLTVNTSIGWAAFEYEVPSDGSYTFTFRFIKDGSGSVGSDCAWINDVKLFRSVSNVLNVPGGQLSFRSNDDYPWVASGDCAKSGNKGISNSESTLTLTVGMNAGDRLTFRAKVSSERDYDKYTFSANGIQQFEKSGNVGWFDHTYTAPDNRAYTFTWNYEKDYSVDSYSDEAYLDDVRLIPIGGLMGDSNDNGSVEIADALLAMRYSMGLIGDNELNTSNADMDKNGSVTIGDATLILRKVLGLI